jgi:protein-ribulosamine 3-kinase
MAQLAPESFRLALETAFHSGGLPLPDLLGLDSVPGGSLNQTFHLRTSEGDFFCKWNPHSPPGMFAREKEGLEALAAAGTSLRIPRVIGLAAGDASGIAFGNAETPALLVLEYLVPALESTSRKTWEKVGRGLAELHRRTETRFGFASDNYCGLTLQENAWTADWPGFYARHRLGTLVDRLKDRGEFPLASIRILEALIAKLPDLLGHAPTPSLIHGDLWNGNFLAGISGPALVDPAASYSDREAEWGMMQLFGGFPETVLDAYQEAWPMPQGWHERLPLYQLYHVLNHYLLFGGSYGEQALGLARQFL